MFRTQRVREPSGLTANPAIPSGKEAATAGEIKVVAFVSRPILPAAVPDRPQTTIVAAAITEAATATTNPVDRRC